MIDSGSNTSLLSKNAAERLGIAGTATHLTMNLAGGEKRSETSEIIEITVASSKEKDIRKTLEVYTIKRPCSAAKTISKETIEHFPHLKPVAKKTASIWWNNRSFNWYRFRQRLRRHSYLVRGTRRADCQT